MTMPTSKLTELVGIVCALGEVDYFDALQLLMSIPIPDIRWRSAHPWEGECNRKLTNNENIWQKMSWLHRSRYSVVGRYLVRETYFLIYMSTVLIVKEITWTLALALVIASPSTSAPKSKEATDKNQRASIWDIVNLLPFHYHTCSWSICSLRSIP